MKPWPRECLARGTGPTAPAERLQERQPLNKRARRQLARKEPEAIILLCIFLQILVHHPDLLLKPHDVNNKKRKWFKEGKAGCMDWEHLLAEMLKYH